MVQLEQNWKDFVIKYSHYGYLFAILLLAIFLRLYKLDFQSLWVDELYSIVPVYPLNTVEFIINYCKSDQPPLFFLILHFWMKLFSYTPLSGRMLVAVFGILGVIAMYFLGKEVSNRKIGLLASFLTSINYFHIYYSQELRFYSLLFLLTVLSFLFFVRSYKKRTFTYYVLYVISTIALLYTQYYGLIIFVTQGIIFIFYVILNKEKISFIITGIVLAIIIFGSFIPWLEILIHDAQITSYWIQEPKPYFFFGYYRVYWGRDFLTEKVTLFIGFIYIWHLVTSFRNKTITKEGTVTAILIISWILFSYLIPYVRSVTSTPILFPRYTLVTLPAIFIVIALGLDLIKRKLFRVTLIALIFSGVMIHMFVVEKYYTVITKAQLREAAQVVIKNHKSDVIVYSNFEWWYNFYFYSTNPRIFVRGRYPTDEKYDLAFFINEVGNQKEFWVLSGQIESNALTDSQAAYTKENFRIKENHTFYQASAVLYERK